MTPAAAGGQSEPVLICAVLVENAAPLRELTLRGILLGGLITLLFTAANVYLGLKVGITFATSIPAAVISMAVLRFVRGSTILENNIVQTIASAAGTLAAIIFVLPGLIMIGWWQGFPYWTTVAVCAIGGTLGVMFSVPLRRALVTGSDLPYPEGVAAAEVLKVGSGSIGGAEENAKGLAAIVAGSIASAGFALLAAMKLAAGELATAFRLGGGAASGASTSLSMALIGVGHLVGMTVGIAMLIGMLTSWAVLVPVLTSMQGVGADVAATVNEVFRNQVRFIGAGTIGVAAVWTLLKIIGPIVAGIRSAMAASAARAGGEVLELTERDLPIGIVGGTILASLVPIAGLLWWFSAGGPIAADAPVVIGATLVYMLVIGAIIAAVCGYMAGLIGASNSPVSGVGILAVLGAAVLLAAVLRHPAGQCAGADRVCPVHHRDRVLDRDHLQRQPPGPEDRPAGRRDAVEAAGGAGDRRDLRLAGDRAGARRPEHLLRLPGHARRGSERAGGAAGGADLVARQRRARRRHQVGSDRLRRADRRGRDRHRRGADPHRANTGCRRSRSAWASICRWR